MKLNGKTFVRITMLSHFLIINKNMLRVNKTLLGTYSFFVTTQVTRSDPDLILLDSVEANLKGLLTYIHAVHTSRQYL